MGGLFVIAVASEKGGVGKTTIATNLAVYLKALREDLPVTIASFDNHFSVDQMFLLGQGPAGSVAELLTGVAADELCTLGQYGVQYLASSRSLQTPAHSPGWLHKCLHGSRLSGVLILDTRPILDWFTEAALLAADLVLVPIKDRASLVNASSLRQLLAAAGRDKRLWLLPSLVDTRARLNDQVRVHEFLAYAARERDYQVLDIFISKSPKVESLASGFSSTIRPVLTHARSTAVHGQLKALAEFVLAQFEGGECDLRDVPTLALETGDLSKPPRRQMVVECPLCCHSSLVGKGHFYFDLRSRRRGFVHPGCFEKVCAELDLEDHDGADKLLALCIDGPGLIGPECRLTAHLCSVDGGLVEAGGSQLKGQELVAACLAKMTGRCLDEAYRELVVVDCSLQETGETVIAKAYRDFSRSRRLVTRELRDAGLF